MAAPPDFGTDLFGINDLDLAMREVSGRELLAQAIARRLQTPRGGLFYDNDYGYDLRALVNAPELPKKTVETNIENEVLKDERILDAVVDVRYEGDPADQLFVRLLLRDGTGPFALVLSVSDVTVEILTETLV